MDRHCLTQCAGATLVIHLDGEMEKWDRQEGRQRQSVRQLRQQESGGRTDTALATVLDVTFFIHLERQQGTEKIRWPDRHS